MKTNEKERELKKNIHIHVCVCKKHNVIYYNTCMKLSITEHNDNLLFIFANQAVYINFSDFANSGNSSGDETRLFSLTCRSARLRSLR